MRLASLVGTEDGEHDCLGFGGISVYMVLHESSFSLLESVDIFVHVFSFQNHSLLQVTKCNQNHLYWKNYWNNITDLNMTWDHLFCFHDNN